MEKEAILRSIVEFCNAIFEFIFQNDYGKVMALPFDGLLNDDFILNFNYKQTVEQVFDQLGFVNTDKLCHIYGTIEYEIISKNFGYSFSSFHFGGERKVLL